MSAVQQQLAQLLEASLDPRQNKQAEAAISQAEPQPGFSLALLQIVASDAFPNTTRLASALYFKNFIRRKWVDEDGNHQLPQDEVTAIKQELVGLMISSQPAIQAQLGEAISVIADSDFYERWDTLIDDLVSRLSANNLAANNGVLQVAHSIFKRWRPLFRSDALFTEINHVLSKFAVPFLNVLQSTDATIQSSLNDKAVLQQAFTTLNLVIKTFYDLSCQDLPPQFEENLPAIAEILHRYLVHDSPLLHTDDDAESGPQEYVRAGIFQVLILYIQKYEDAFGVLLPQFIGSSWNLLTNVGPETKYDIMVSRALQFLTSIARIKEHAQTFNSQETIGQVVEKVILPNVTLRDSDVELFEDEPIEFIRRDLEGSDSDTRRRAATDFLRQLKDQFNQLVTGTVQRYIDHYLQDYSKDPKGNWKSKDTAVYLFSSIAASGTVTSGQGVTILNDQVDFLGFFQSNIAPDLTSQDIEPLLKVDAIKYLYVFRSLIAREHWQQALPLLAQHLKSTNYVVYTYAAIAIERALFVQKATQPMLTREDVQPVAQDLLTNLFRIIERNSAPEKIQENEFLMRCVMRVLIVLRDGIIPMTQVIARHFINITNVIRHNPSNPRFYYYHFEGIGALIRFTAPSQTALLESSFYDPFADILRNDVQEFIPYVFQLFAALLEANATTTLPDYYRTLLEPILLPSLWETKGNVPALVRLLSSIIQRGATTIVQANQMEPILGIFQKLIASKNTEVQAFELLETIVSSFPPAALQPYFQPIFQLILTRLSNSKTENLTSRFVRLYHLISAKVDDGLGTDFLVGVLDQIQNNVFTPLYMTIVLPDTQKLSRPVDRKTAVISLTKNLVDSQAFAERYGNKGWGFTCEALIKLLVNPPVPGATDDIIVEQDVDDVGFGVGFTQLTTCRKVPVDPFPQVTNVRTWAGQYLKEGDAKTNGRVGKFIDMKLSEEARNALVAYMSS